MKCPYSVTLRDKFTVMGEPMKRPCGECAICRRNALMTLVSRANSEFKKHKYNAFICLTYDDNHLYFSNRPFGENIRVGLPSVSKEHIKTFIDDFRHYVKRHSLSNCDKDFSFVACSEYGGQFARPHYHICLFGVDFPVAKKIASKCWKYGFVDSRPVSSGSIRYVCKYLSKGAKGKFADLQYFDKGVNKPFVYWSKGLGRDYFYSNYENIKKNGYIKDGNKKIFVPSYYKNKIVNFNLPQLFKQEIDRQFTWTQKHNLAKHYGFNSVDDMEREMALSSIRNELNKDILRRQSVDLSEIEGVNY